MYCPTILSATCLLFPYTPVPPDDWDGTKSAVTRVEDANSDGVPDFAVASRRPGATTITLHSGKDGSLLVRFQGVADDDPKYSRCLASAGDVDHDGSGDLIVGGKGYAVVLSGKSGELVHRLEPEDRLVNFGTSVSGGHDLDGDHTPDLVVGSPGLKRAAFAYSGRSGEILCTYTSEDAAAGFGRTVAITPALNDNGVTSVLVADPGRSPGGTQEGGIFIFEGVGGMPVSVIEGPKRLGVGESGLAWAIGVGGDVNGDGTNDIVASVLHEYVIAFSGATHDVLQEHTFGTHVMAARGSSVDIIGDVNGDKCADIVYGASESLRLGRSFDPGFMAVMSGSTGEVLHAYQAERDGIDALGLGDVDGDSTPDILLFLTRSSRVQVLSGGSFEVIYSVTVG